MSDVARNARVDTLVAIHHWFFRLGLVCFFFGVVTMPWIALEIGRQTARYEEQNQQVEKLTRRIEHQQRELDELRLAVAVSRYQK